MLAAEENQSIESISELIKLEPLAVRLTDLSGQFDLVTIDGDLEEREN